MSKPWPTLTSDEEAERFVDEADLSEYDFSVGKRVRLVLRVPEGFDRLSVNLPSEDVSKAVREANAADKPLADYLGELLHEALAAKAA